MLILLHVFVFFVVCVCRCVYCSIVLHLPVCFCRKYFLLFLAGTVKNPSFHCFCQWCFTVWCVASFFSNQNFSHMPVMCFRDCFLWLPLRSWTLLFVRLHQTTSLTWVWLEVIPESYPEYALPNSHLFSRGDYLKHKTAKASFIKERVMLHHALSCMHMAPIKFRMQNAVPEAQLVLASPACLLPPPAWACPCLLAFMSV